MKKYTTLSLILMLLSFPLLGQNKTDLEKNKLFGKIKSILSFKVNYGYKNDTILFSKEYYNENGMNMKYIDFSEYSKIDSIVNTYNKKNQLISKVEYKRVSSLSSDDVENSNDTSIYEYNNKCNEPTTIKSSKRNYQINYIFDDKCRRISETEIGRGRTQITQITYDSKERLIKQTFTYEGEKPDKVETYKYDDEKNTLTYLEYSPRYDVYREKTVTQFSNTQKIIQKTFFNMPTAGGSITFSKGSKNEPNQIYLIKKYQFNSDDKLIMETHLDGNNNELLKVEVFYDDKKELKEQKFYKNGHLEYREEYKYADGKRLEEKQFLLDNKKPQYIKTRKYNANGQLLEFILFEDNNRYSNKYVYDQFNNKIEKKELKNDKLLNTVFTKIEYYK
ncbi:hypothetical protein [Elizabethkingia ursingii]|uniref:Sugar-binding protein n=1 Tax=Elizabethkingia ursingii TaxID=1756150 RepID=A0ABX3NH45_9FLAO|nr:hypothetical protein [Elizabethkingia ursingii]OPB94515.1 hypothetical protein BB021_18100 [Elizabethkingia ursingii]